MGTIGEAIDKDMLAPVWPDLAKFRHFGIKNEAFGDS